MKSGIFT